MNRFATSQAAAHVTTNRRKIVIDYEKTIYSLDDLIDDHIVHETERQTQILIEQPSIIANGKALDEQAFAPTTTQPPFNVAQDARQPVTSCVYEQRSKASDVHKIERKTQLPVEQEQPLAPPSILAHHAPQTKTKCASQEPDQTLAVKTPQVTPTTRRSDVRYTYRRRVHSKTLADIPPLTTTTVPMLSAGITAPSFSNKIPNIAAIPLRREAPALPPNKILWRGMFISAGVMPYLDRVDNHHGDIFSSLIIRSPHLIASTAESLAKCINILDRCNPRTITCQEILFLNASVKGFEALGVRVDWLASKLVSVVMLRSIYTNKQNIERFEKSKHNIEAQLEVIRTQLGVFRRRVEFEELACGGKEAIDFDQPFSQNFV